MSTDGQSRDRYLVTVWAEQLQAGVARSQASLRRLPSLRKYPPAGSAWHDIARRWRRELDETRSLHELVGRGLDPGRQRRFKGRVSVLVRCAPRGHVLGQVYPTSLHPVFVPVVSALPVGPNADAARADARLRAGQRDPWLAESSEPPDPAEPTPEVYILGLTVLSPHFLDHHDQHPDAERIALFLLCRCGQRYLYLDDLRRAVEASRRVLSV